MIVSLRGRKKEWARERDTRGESELAPSLLACLPLAPVLSRAHYFQAPANQATS